MQIFASNGLGDGVSTNLSKSHSIHITFCPNFQEFIRIDRRLTKSYFCQQELRHYKANEPQSSILESGHKRR